MLLFRLLDPVDFGFVSPLELGRKTGYAFGLLASGARAQDPEAGRALYETYCGTCHYERVHQRLRSEVKDLADLRDFVARWAPQTKRQFTLNELEDVAQYLNQSHYRFGLAPRETPTGRR